MPIALLVTIGWLYVTLLMGLAQPTFLAGASTMIFYGLLPAALILYVMRTPERRRRRRARELAETQGSAASSSLPSGRDGPPPDA